MSARTASRASSRRPSRTARRRVWRRRLVLLLGGLLALAAIAAALTPLFDKAVKELSLPLRHEDVIRQQAADKDLDPALIAAVIYAESRFVDQTSEAGAKGLMQILPTTADYIADLSGGTQFEQGDLASPQINIAYGSYYLRYLMDKYEGNTVLALAAYNAGEGRVDGWRASGAEVTVDAIPFPETHEYVKTVLGARSDYRQQYARELGV